MIRCFEIRLTIPDNEARTAFATLERLGAGAASLERAELYRCDVDDEAAAGLAAELRACEGIFNPNKHALVERDGDAPEPGEVWVDEPGPGHQLTAPVVVSGRTLAGVRSLERYVAWRLAGDVGAPAAREAVVAATTALLCNTAFQRARYEEAAR